MIKYLRIPDEIFDMVKEDIVVNKARGRTDNQKNRAPRGARQGIIFLNEFKLMNENFLFKMCILHYLFIKY